MYEYYYKSPVGCIKLEANETALTYLGFSPKPSKNSKNCPEVIETAVLELDQYFAGKLKKFSVNTFQEATEFRTRVYEELVKIPYGEVISYKELARRIGNPKAVRAVGGANHHNKISIIIPCHRVIGANGSLVGYGGGMDSKRLLLDLEKKYKDSSTPVK